MHRRSILPIIILIVAVQFFCGGSSEQGNSRVIGSVVDGNNTGPMTVFLTSASYNPLNSDTKHLYKVQTDSSGNYEFYEIPHGTYYLSAKDSIAGTACLSGPYSITAETERLGVATMLPTGYLLASFDNGPGDSVVALYIKGTTIIVPVSGQADTIVIPSVPAGQITVETLVRTSSSSLFNAFPYCEDLTVVSGDTLGIGYLNRPPVITTGITDLQKWFYPEVMYIDTISATDPDGGAVTFSFVNQPEGVFSIDSAAGIIRWYPFGYLLMTGYQFSIVASDAQGAFSTIGWEVQQATRSETALMPDGDSESTVDTFCEYSTTTVACTSSAAEYRFSWGDGDTSAWSISPAAQHFWRRKGTFSVQVQTSCGDYPLPSEWSSSLQVSVTGTASVDSSLQVHAPSEATANTTIRISADSYGCDDALYRFYLDDTGISPWVADPVFDFIPQLGGTHRLTVSVRCGAGTTQKVVTSSPAVIRIVKTYAPCMPIVVAEAGCSGNYGCMVYVNAPPTTCSDFGTGCRYRFAIRSLDPERPFADTTEWALVNYFDGEVPVDSVSQFGVRAQMRCLQDSAMVDSDWSEQITVKSVFQ